MLSYLFLNFFKKLLIVILYMFLDLNSLFYSYQPQTQVQITN